MASAAIQVAERRGPRGPELHGRPRCRPPDRADALRREGDELPPHPGTPPPRALLPDVGASDEVQRSVGDYGRRVSLALGRVAGTLGPRRRHRPHRGGPGGRSMGGPGEALRPRLPDQKADRVVRSCERSRSRRGSRSSTCRTSPCPKPCPYRSRRHRQPRRRSCCRAGCPRSDTCQPGSTA